MYLLAIAAIVFAVSLLFSLLLVPLFKKLSFRLNALDIPDKRKTHSRPTPLLGGVAIYLSFSLVILASLLVIYFFLAGSSATRVLTITIPNVLRVYARNLHENSLIIEKIAIIFGGGVLILLIGLFDDFKNLSVMARFAAEIIVATAVVWLGIKPELYIFPPEVVGIITVFWIVGITNSFNLLDGMDGLAAGVGFIAAGILAFVMATNDQPLVALLLCAFAGSLLGFLRHNFHPASIFMGSSGSMFIGYMLSVSVLVGTFMKEGERNTIPIIMPILILGVPLYDTFSVILIRLKNKKPITKADKNHVAHRLFRLGLTQKQAVLFIYLMTFCIGNNATLLGSASLLGNTTFGSFVILVQIAATFGIIIILERVNLLSKRTKKKKEKDGSS